MSGGFLEYRAYAIEEIIKQIEKAIDDNNKPFFDLDTPYSWEKKANKEFLESGGTRYSLDTINVFKDAKNDLKRLSIIIHRIDWLLSGDDGEDEFHELLEKELKNFKND